MILLDKIGKEETIPKDWLEGIIKELLNCYRGQI